MSRSYQKISADWVMPVSSEPIPHGIIILDSEGRIVDLYAPDTPHDSQEDIRYYNGVLIPGLINGHCHLELSHLEGRIEAGCGLDGFIRSVTHPSLQVRVEEKAEAMRTAASQLLHSGTVAVLDITDDVRLAQVKAESGLYVHQTLELFGTDPDQAEEKMNTGLEKVQALLGCLPAEQVSISPHATYSVSIPLFERIKAFAEEHNRLISLHFMENPDEEAYFLHGNGPVRGRQEAFGITRASGFPRLRPIEAISPYLPRHQPVVFVHNTVALSQDIDFITGHFSNPWFCLCPNANLYIEGRLPEVLIASGPRARMVVGTDSLAGNRSLSVFEELKTLGLRQGLSLTETLPWATINGARLLGIEPWAGSLEKGKAPGVALIEHLDMYTFIPGPETGCRLITRCHPS